MPRGPARPFSVAPMMDWTDRHYRRFVRGLTRRALLYTEMVTAAAVLHGDRERLLGFDEVEHPVAVQLGGDDPAALAEAARAAVAWGYDEVNLNVGCPSDRVQRGRFGACLMAHPEVVAEAVRALRQAVAVPVTVKHRLGIDDLDGDAHLHGFVAALVDAGVDRVVVHARKAWLEGLSPKENRTVPPLQHERVVALKRAFPGLRVETNGGVRDLDAVRAHLRTVDGVMVGRAAYEDSFVLAGVDAAVFGEEARPSRAEAVAAYLPYVEARRCAGTPLPPLVKPLIGLARGARGGRSWRRTLSEGSVRPGAGPELIERALAALPDEVRDARPDAAAAATPVGATADGVGSRASRSARPPTA
ncbi:MAG: tRNA dihydrouridine(20/20a) synthase DusA [Trueperaceae bacterium]|nr:tRNA dihydrouridine(20/20a) synthase DusA [Trueperaceae bacterium]